MADRYPECTCGEHTLLNNIADCERTVNAMHACLLKVPWSGSGKGLNWCLHGFTKPVSNWCERVLREHASNGVVKVPGYEQLVRFGYTKNRGVYRLAVTASGEWQDLTIRAFWHVPGGKDPASSLVVDGSVDVPASVTAQPGNGCITFEGSDGTKTVTSADLRYRVSANSGTEDGTEPEPDSPAWQQLVDAVHKDATAAEQAKTDAQTAAQQAGAAAQKAAASYLA